MNYILSSVNFVGMNKKGGNESVRGNEHTIHLEMNKHLEMKTLVEMNAEMKGA